MLLKIALNGARPKSENQFLPHSLDEIEKEVRLVYTRGYTVFHIHCYDKNGNESLEPDNVKNLVKTVKDISNNIQIGISSGEWIEPDYDRRIHLIESWDVIPDFISVNMIEDHAVDISRLLISKGILVEAGLNEKKAAENFAESSLIDGVTRILIEPDNEDTDAAIKAVNEIEGVLEYRRIKIPKLLHGYNTTVWPLLKEAKRRGYDARIGMEDTIYLEDGNKVSGNTELIEEAERILEL